MPDKEKITGLILAGGRGTRMGSVDKGLQILNGKPMVFHIIQRLSPQVGSLMISANQNLEAYRKFGYPVLPDEIGGYEGPLAGLQTGLRHTQTPYLITAPCDGPFLPEDFVSKLWHGMKSQYADVAVATSGDGENERTQPVYCLLKTSLLSEIENYLRSGQRKMDGWYASRNVAKIHFEDETAFRNINTLDELERYSHK